jgi:hypothetical protein
MKFLMRHGLRGLIKIYEIVLEKLPGSELRRCSIPSSKDTNCIRHLNHWGRHEDAWFYKWRE